MVNRQKASRGRGTGSRVSKGGEEARNGRPPASRRASGRLQRVASEARDVGVSEKAGAEALQCLRTAGSAPSATPEPPTHGAGGGSSGRARRSCSLPPGSCAKNSTIPPFDITGANAAGDTQEPAYDVAPEGDGGGSGEPAPAGEKQPRATFTSVGNSTQGLADRPSISEESGATRGTTRASRSEASRPQSSGAAGKDRDKVGVVFGSAMSRHEREPCCNFLSL